MTKRIYALLVLLFCVTFAFAQSSLDVPSYEGSTSFQDEEKTDLSDNYFPPKPKHGTEIGLSLGHHFIHGDVYTRPGFGVGLHVRRAFNYTMSWRVQGVYGRNTGLDTRISNFGQSGIQINRPVWQGFGYNNESTLYRNYQTTTGWVSGHFIANVSNILFHKKSNKWNLYAFAGPSLLYYKGKTNVRNNDGGAYQDGGNPGMQAVLNINETSGIGGWFNSTKLDAIKDILDDSYETEFVYSNGQGSAANVQTATNLNLLRSATASLMPSVDVGLGFSYKFSEKLNIALEHQALVSLNDNLDGHDRGRNVDVPHFTNLKINFNLNPKEGVEPLYWVNPLRAPMEDIAQLKRDKVELKDTDGDGVLDNFDEEPDTPEGAAVDTKGRRLDSDGDGVFDDEDEEPYTPYNLISGVDSKGVAPAPEMPEPGLTREQIIALGKDQKWDVQGGGTTVIEKGCGDWFLPMIHFDLDKSNLKSEAKASLHHIAQVMKKCPEICVVAIGHTDRLNSNNYNQTLSYNRAKNAVDYLVQVYGISPSRLKVNYGGEETPIVDTNGSSYINRRVEFRVCNGETDMGAPDGAAGSSSSSGFGTSGSAPVKY